VFLPSRYEAETPTGKEFPRRKAQARCVPLQSSVE
jgi:hypothetical protein